MIRSRGFIKLTAVLATAAMSFVAFRFLLWTPVAAPQPAPVAAPDPSPDPQQVQPPPKEVAAMLTRVGLDPAALAAAGAAPGQLVAMVAAAKDAMAAGSVASLDAAAAASRAERDRLERIVRSGLGSEGDVAAYPVALQQAATAQASLRAALDAIAASAGAGFGADVRARLDGIRSRRAAWDGLPLPYLVVEGPEPGRVALRDALAAKRIAAKAGQEPDPIAEQIVSEAQSDVAVQTSLADVQTLNDAIQTAWNAAVFG